LRVIDGFGAAVAAAASLADEFRHCHAVALTDGGGTVLHLWAFTAPRDTADTAIRWALSAASGAGWRAEGAVLVSVLSDVDLSIPTEVDVEGWRSASARFAAAGLELIEWVLASGGRFRSLALTAAAYARSP